MAPLLFRFLLITHCQNFKILLQVKLKVYISKNNDNNDNNKVGKMFIIDFLNFKFSFAFADNILKEKYLLLIQEMYDYLK